MNEFDLIDTFFKSETILPADVLLGIGDDAACLQVPPNMNLLVTTDTLVSGVHFRSEWDAYDIAYRAVCVNVSDIAAMAGEPRWATLSLTLPTVDEAWLARFAEGLKDSLTTFNTALVGGDTTRGPLAITLTIMGLTPPNAATARSGAKPGDVIMASQPLGIAALALSLLDSKGVKNEDRKQMMQALLRPMPRLDLLPFLRQYASAAIDVSDGFSADLQHICRASGVGASLRQADIPIHPLVEQYAPLDALQLALNGGDDYALCFTVPPSEFARLEAALKTAGLLCYSVGFIKEGEGLEIVGLDNKSRPLQAQGYLHF
jgi:thiamine-monophosphate kinase